MERRGEEKFQVKKRIFGCGTNSHQDTEDEERS